MRWRSNAIPAVSHAARSTFLLAALACMVAGSCAAQSSRQSAAPASRLATTQGNAHAAARNTPEPATALAPHPAEADPNQAIADECAELFRLAVDLKSAVNKTTKDMLSVTVLRKADSLEQLAHKVKDQMKPRVKR